MVHLPGWRILRRRSERGMGGGVLLTLALSVAALWTLAEGQREQIDVPTRAHHLGLYAEDASVELRGLQWYSQAEDTKEAYVSAQIPARGGSAGYVLAEFEVAESIEMRSSWDSPRPFLVATATEMSTGGPASGAPAVPPYRVTDEGNFKYFDTDATPSLQQDEEGFWTQKRYHYLVLNASLPWTLFMLNFNLNPRIAGEDPHVLNGTLHLSFLDGGDNERPCPRGTALSPCSSSGDCDEGKCECGAFWAGRFCEEPVVKMSNVHHEGLYQATADIPPFSAVHFRFIVECERNAGDACNDLLTGVLRGDESLLALMRKTEYQRCPRSGKLEKGTETNEYFVDRMCFETPLDHTQRPFPTRQGEVLYFSLYNDSNSTVHQVTLKVQVCGEDGCEYSSDDLVTLFLLCNFIAILVPTIAVLCWKQYQRQRRRASGRQTPGLSKRQINLMFPEETYKTSAMLAETVSEPGDDSECIVCLSEYEDGDLVRRLPCGHMYHARCLDQWIVKSATCPRCRQPAVAPASTPV